MSHNKDVKGVLAMTVHVLQNTYDVRLPVSEKDSCVITCGKSCSNVKYGIGLLKLVD